MEPLEWVMSEGGPLICIERRLARQWGGIYRLSVPKDGAGSDYDRAPDRLKYLQAIEVPGGEALIFGEGPLDTSFWQSESGSLYIVRISCCEEDTDFSQIVNGLDARIFEKTDEVLHFTFETGDLVMFDSAEEGTEPNKKTISAAIRPGPYKIRTKYYDPDPSCSLVLHRFDLQDQVP